MLKVESDASTCVLILRLGSIAMLLLLLLIIVSVETHHHPHLLQLQSLGHRCCSQACRRQWYQVESCPGETF